MQHLPTFAESAGRLPGENSRGWLHMKNTIFQELYTGTKASRGCKTAVLYNPTQPALASVRNPSIRLLRLLELYVVRARMSAKALRGYFCASFAFKLLNRNTNDALEGRAKYLRQGEHHRKSASISD
jgi:hypothetical protein